MRESLGGVHDVTPEVFDPGESPQIETLFGDSDGWPQRHGIAVHARLFLMERELLGQVVVEVAAAAKLEQETAHGRQLARTRWTAADRRPQVSWWAANSFRPWRVISYVLGSAVVVGNAPLGPNGAIELEAMEGRIERSLLDLQYFIGEQMDCLRDGIPMQHATL